MNIVQEAGREPTSLVLVPSRGLLEIGLGERPNDEPASHDGLPGILELLAKARLNRFPTVTSVRGDVELLQPLVEDFMVPVGNRNRCRTGCKSIP